MQTDSNSDEKTSLRAELREHLREAVKLSIELGETNYFLPEAADALNFVLRDEDLTHLCITSQNISETCQDLAIYVAADALEQAQAEEEDEEEDEELS